jgi:hypothetical protein
VITDGDRAALADLAMRALDTIQDDYGDGAEFLGATLVFEVRVPDPDDEEDPWLYHGNYKSTPDLAPSHVGGMCQSMACWLLGNKE